MSGAIGLAAGDFSRYAAFNHSLRRLEVPSGTSVYSVNSQERWMARNELVRAVLENGNDWLLMLDDDHVFESDLLSRLLSHEVAIVGAFYVQKQSPFAPICLVERLEDGFVPIDLSTAQTEGLIEVAAVGTGGLLVRREVFEILKEPWFRPAEMSEDLVFCDDATTAGFKIHCDLSARMGHMTTTSVWPASPNDEWALAFTLAGETTFYRRVNED